MRDHFAIFCLSTEHRLNNEEVCVRIRSKEMRDMNNYVTGSTIKILRESKKLTQAQLANMISVSDKAVSRWETGKEFPDVSLLEPLSKALGISVIELISGDWITNRNVSSNMQRSKFYVCPICGNVIHSMGEALVSCCGITLPCLEAEETDNDHYMNVEYDG